MHIAELRFRMTGRSGPEACDAIYDLLRALERNGQLVPNINRLCAHGPGVLRCYVSLPEANSLKAAKPNKHVSEALAGLRDHGVGAPTVRVLGREPTSAPVCTCRRRSALVLETTFLTEELPLQCGDCAGVVPFYRFKHTSGYHTYEDIIFWLYHYQCFDAQWTYSGPGERLAYQQLSSIASDLTREGRDVCRMIEKRTRVPVYYALHRYYGRSLAAERRRRCPGCGGPWRLDDPWLGYDFRCRRCRLVSRIACDVRQ